MWEVAGKPFIGQILSVPARHLGALKEESHRRQKIPPRRPFSGEKRMFRIVVRL